MSHTLESKIYHALKEQFPGDFAWAAGAQTATKIAEAHYAKSEPDHGNFRLDEHIDPALLDPLVESYMLDRDERGAQMANLPSFSEWYAMASDPNAHQKIAEPDWFKAAVRTDGCDWECIHCGAGYHMQPVTETCSVIDCPMNLLRPTASMATPVEGALAKPDDLLLRSVSLLKDLIAYDVLYLENRGIFTTAGYEQLRLETKAILREALSK